MGYVWCDGYVWDMCGVRYVWDMCGVRYVWDMCGVRYVWDMCGVRYANNLLKNHATKRLSGKTFTTQKPTTDRSPQASERFHEIVESFGKIPRVVGATWDQMLGNRKKTHLLGILELASTYRLGFA